MLHRSVGVNSLFNPRMSATLRRKDFLFIILIADFEDTFLKIQGKSQDVVYLDIL